jgi:hypothetical protein
MYAVLHLEADSLEAVYFWRQVEPCDVLHDNKTFVLVTQDSAT